MKSYADKERMCEMAFQRCGPYWHAFTNGRETAILFTNTADLAFVMNVIAQAAWLFRPRFSPGGLQTGGIVILALAVMNNHFHFVVAGERQMILDFFAFIRRRLARTIPAAKELELIMKPIDSLNSLRNNIVYTNRNGYVAHAEHTPFSYPWSTGRYYFNDIPLHNRYDDIFLGPKRLMFRGRAPQLPEDWQMTDGYIAPSAYCDIRFGMTLFRDAHHYFNAVSRQVEAYGELALALGDDDEFLTDTELFVKLSALIRERYKLSGLKDLTRAQKTDIARILHYDYHSSNGQIRRILGLTQFEIDSMFTRPNS